MIRNIIVFLFGLSSCVGNSQQLKTPKEFINNTTVNIDAYSSDSAAIIANLFVKMKNREPSFANPEYFDSTVLIVDTIMYDSSLNKIAIFLIAKNPTYRNPYSKSSLPYYYNASCYLGKRQYPDSSVFELRHFGPFTLANFDDKELIRKAIRDYYFLELATVLDEKKNQVFRYNLNDSRFWDSSTGWKRMF